MDLIDKLVARHIAGQISQGIESATRTGEEIPMNPLEQFAITIVLGVLQTVVKNSASKAALQNQLLGIAADIQMAYGLVPPAPPAA